LARPATTPSTSVTMVTHIRFSAVILAIAGTATTVAAQEVDTRLVVRVLAHDAKIIGSGVGGARVTVTDLASGEVLAQGVQQGSTGDTRSIMVAPRLRGTTVYDTEGTASFDAVLSLSEPTMIQVTAEGPLGTPHAVQRASKTMLMIPGVDVVGEGLILELMGFTVELQVPQEPSGEAAGLVVQAKTTMLCGCPTSPDGMWDSNSITILARLLAGDREVAQAPLEFAGTTSTYRGQFGPVPPGDYTLQVLALDPAQANFGMATRRIELR